MYFINKKSYKPEYMKAHWWVKYDEQPLLLKACLFVYEKWAKIVKGNYVHQIWIKIPLKTLKKDIKKFHNYENS